MSEVVILSEFIVRDTPGLERALTATPILWTARLREILSGMGLDTSQGTQVFYMRARRDWMFCNALTYPEAERKFKQKLAQGIRKASDYFGAMPRE